MSASTEWGAREGDRRLRLPEGVRTVRNARGQIDLIIDGNTVWQVHRLPHGHASGFTELQDGSIKSAVFARHGAING